MRQAIRCWVACLAILTSPAALAEIRLGVHSEEPAPTIGELISTLTPAGRGIRIVAFDSSQQVLESLQAGEVDLGIVEEAGQAGEGLGLVEELYPSVLHMLHRGGFQFADVGELLAAGHIWAGPPGSIGYRVAQNLSRDFALQEGRPRLMPDPWSQEPDIYFVFGGILAPDAIARLPDFQIYGLDEPGALMQGSVAEGVALRYPYLRPFVLPAQLYPSLGDKAALTLAVSNVLVARESLDAPIVYQLAMGVEHLAPRIAAAYPMAGLPQLSGGSPPARAMALHPGARRYRDRDLPGFIERNAEVLGLGATLIIAAGSLLVAWQRRRKLSRKDTLDRYYQQLLDLREELADPDCQLPDVTTRIRDTQAEVMALVIEERIDADGSLLAFLSLSNQLLEETRG